ncbi:MULE transposase domain-containing protein [Phthorimaea operculella]|nr:MULE transposase domain-containing protein [Phthorimaea operculella]
MEESSSPPGSEEDEKNDFEFIETERGGKKLLRAGHQFCLNVKNATGTTIWRCVNRSVCNGSLTLNDKMDRIIREGKHACSPDFYKNKIDKCMNNCKNRVRTEFKPVSKIYAECMNSSNSELETSDSDSNQEIPEVRSKIDALYYARRKALKVPSEHFKSIKDVVFPKILTDKFLLFEADDKNPFFIFGTPKYKKYIEETDLFLVDGTFKVVPGPFEQLFSIHVDLNSTSEDTMVIPVFYCLLLDKKQETYEKLFQILKENFGLVISKLKCDYEMAVINAVKKIFPDVRVKGCFFHFSQAIWKNAVDLGLIKRKKRQLKKKARQIQTSEEEKVMKKIVKYTCNLALLPASYIPEGWEEIMKLMPEENNPNIEQFKNYFITQWFSSVTADVWCCVNERHRTTNAVEAWHRRLNSKVEDKGYLFSFIYVLKKEASRYDRLVKQAQVGPRRVKKRRTNIMIKDAKVAAIIDDLLKKKATTLQCLKKLSMIKMTHISM